LPSPENATELTQPPCGSVAICWPLAASQRRALLSSLPVAICWPLGENAIALTPAVWPVSTLRRVPLAVSQIAARSSKLAVAARLPSLENATAKTLFSCPASSVRELPRCV